MCVECPQTGEHCHKPPLQIYCDSFRSIRECVCLCVYTYICIYALWQNNNSPIGNWQLAKDINTIIMEKKNTNEFYTCRQRHSNSLIKRNKTKMRYQFKHTGLEKIKTFNNTRL